MQILYVVSGTWASSDFRIGGTSWNQFLWIRRGDCTPFTLNSMSQCKTWSRAWSLQSLVHLSSAISSWFCVGKGVEFPWLATIPLTVPDPVKAALLPWLHTPLSYKPVVTTHTDQRSVFLFGCSRCLINSEITQRKDTEKNIILRIGPHGLLALYWLQRWPILSTALK